MEALYFRTEKGANPINFHSLSIFSTNGPIIIHINYLFLVSKMIESVKKEAV